MDNNLVKSNHSGSRVLIYSHDTMGLGHLRRCRAIANSLVEKYEDLSVLILSGSPIIGSFDFSARVDFVRIPGVIKLKNGEYKIGISLYFKNILYACPRSMSLYKMVLLDDSCQSGLFKLHVVYVLGSR